VGPPDEPIDLIQYRPEPPAYRLAARAYVYDDFADLIQRRVSGTVLVVEDEPSWGEAIQSELCSAGFIVRAARTLEEAKRLAQDEPPDLVSLDLQIPGDASGLEAGQADEANGAKFLAFLQEQCPDARVAVLTAVEWMDRAMIDLLRKGVCISDYISKHWDHPVERLRGSLWRLLLEMERGVRLPPTGAEVRVHRVEIAPGTPDVCWVDGQQVHLAPGPARVFRALVGSRNAPVDREMIKDVLWGNADDWPDDHDGALNTVMRRLREQIGRATGSPATGQDVIRAKDGVYWLQGMVRIRGTQMASESQP
jgi:DNA-binding response OmpR family regulator